MNARQKKVTADSFQLLSAGAQRGKRLVKEGATIAEVKSHVKDLERLVVGMKEALSLAEGAGAVLEQVANKRGHA